MNIDISNVISSAVNSNPNPAAQTPNCGVCHTALTAEEHANHLEAGETSEFLCDKCAEGTGPEAPKPDPVAAALQAELARLQAENAKLQAAKSGKPAPPNAPNPPATPSPVTGTLAGTYPESANSVDRILLDMIHKFKTTDAKFIAKLKPGQVPGTFAVKVHGYLKSAGVGDQQVRDAVESAAKRGIISRMSIPTARGQRMMLYFDARERKPFEFSSNGPSATEKASIMAAFGK